MNISKRTDNELLDTLEMLIHVLDEKNITKPLMLLVSYLWGGNLTLAKMDYLC